MPPPHSAEQPRESRGSQVERGLSLGVRCIFRPARSSPSRWGTSPRHQLPGAGARRGEARVRAALPAHAGAPVYASPSWTCLPAAAAEQAGGEWPPRAGRRLVPPLPHRHTRPAHGARLGVPWGARDLCCGSVRRKGTSPTPGSAALIPVAERRMKSGLWEDPAHWVHCEAGAGTLRAAGWPRSHSRASSAGDVG